MREKTENIKPILLKAGIPLALTLAGFLFSIIIRRKGQSPQQANTNGVLYHEEFKEQDDSDGLDSTSLEHKESVEEEQDSHLMQTQDSVSAENFQIQCPNESSESEVAIEQEAGKSDSKEELEDLKNQVSTLQYIEGEVEARFLHYCSLQEYGSALKELQSGLELEMAHVEFLCKKVESAAAENRRFEAMVAGYPRVIKALLSAKSDAELLRKRIKKLWKINREAILVLRRQALIINAREAEISSKEEELQWKEGEITELENTIVELRGKVDQMEKEKKVLMDKQEMRESLATPASKDDEEELPGGYSQLRTEYQELLNQIEKFQKEQTADADVLIYLRRVNGCLRYELAKSQQRPEDEEKGKLSLIEIKVNDEKGLCNSAYNLDSSFTGTEHGEPNPYVTATKHPGSNTRVLHKLKKWVKGKEKQKGSFDEKEKCSGSCSASDNVVKESAAARNLSSHVTTSGGGDSTV